MSKMILPVCLLIVWLSACDNTLNLSAPWKDIPIVYGVLSPADTAHYVRIEKAFLDPNRSALEVARIPDSLYYTSLDASIVHINTGTRYTLVPVDGAAEGYPRQDGIFATSPNILYKLAAPQGSIRSGDRYRIEIQRSGQLPLVTAETVVVGAPNIVQPTPGGNVRFVYNNVFRIIWQHGSGAAFYDVRLTVSYEEYHVSEPDIRSEESVEWQLGSSITDNTAEVMGIAFYEFLNGHIESDPMVRRAITDIAIQVRSGGAEIHEFRRVQQANVGITSAGGDIPQYTNLSEGIGLFSSSNRHLRSGLILHPESRDSLIMGSITKHLNFL